MYILQINSKVFIQIKPNEVVITPNYEKTIKYNTIEEAMGVVSELNKLIGNLVIKIIKYDYKENKIRKQRILAKCS